MGSVSVARSVSNRSFFDPEIRVCLSLIVFAPVANAKSWWPRQMPNTGIWDELIRLRSASTVGTQYVGSPLIVSARAAWNIWKTNRPITDKDNLKSFVSPEGLILSQFLLTSKWWAILSMGKSQGNTVTLAPRCDRDQSMPLRRQNTVKIKTTWAIPL